VKSAEVLERLLPRWRATLAPSYSPATIDGFIRRRRGDLADLVAQALARRNAEAGEEPDTAVEFAAYSPIVDRERRHDAGTDKAALARLMKVIDKDLAAGYREGTVLSNVGLEYVDTRAEAIMMRTLRGWDAVPLLLDRPALAFVAAGSVVALRGAMGRLAIHPERRGTLNQIHFDLAKVEDKIVHLREDMNAEWNTKERLDRYAKSLWRRARALLRHQIEEKRTYP
jgi:hypothetical protein